MEMQMKAKSNEELSNLSGIEMMTEYEAGIGFG